MELKIIPVVQVFIAAVMMYILAILLPNLHYLFSLKTVVAIIVLAVSAVIAGLAIYGFRKHDTTVNPKHPEETNQIVNSGIYAYSRNPMYLAFFLILFALAIFLGNIATFMILPLFIMYITRFQIIPEERMLNNHFGLAYKAYTGTVRRWL